MKTNSPKRLMFILGMVLTSQMVSAKVHKYPAIYPFVPMDTNEIYSDVENVTENKRFEKNFLNIVNDGLSKARTKTKPWTSTYWPMSKGLIADPYEDTTLGYYIDTGWIDWDSNYDAFKKRLKKVLSKIDTLEQKDLDDLAPSEKYDLLLGDKNFDLTRRVWEYTNSWGSKKENGFVTRLFISHEDALGRAQYYVNSLKWFKDTNEAFEKAWELQDTLSVKNALLLVKMGKYSTVDEAFPEALEMAKEEEGNYVLAKKNSRLAAWEGICNGWSTAAGNVPRPRNTVSFNLETGKKLNFYPEDIKGLVSMFWVNSLIQNNFVKDTSDPRGEKFFGGTISAGKRCNLQGVKRDIWGRKYDQEADPFNGDHSARCSGVHPAKWHLGLVDIIGRQGRSFIVERKVGPAVDNHPMYKYEMEYFNPNSGRSKEKLEDNIEEINEDDQFKQFRNKKAKYIVGVQTTMTYMDYMMPSRKGTNSEKDDSEVDKRMYYDLELDRNYNIVGGQWRAVKVGMPPESSSSQRARLNHNQPDFFWNVTKDWNNTNKTTLFAEENIPEKWTDKSKRPPKSWLKYAVGDASAGIQGSHEFNYVESWAWGNGRKCDVVNKETGKISQFPCDMETNKPQPLLNVVNALVKLAK